MLKTWIYCITIALGISGAALAAECRAKYGEVIEIDSCKIVSLPDFDARFKGIKRPNPKVPIACWNYELTSKMSDAPVVLEHCHTGLLGGSKAFTLGNTPYTIVFDLMRQCGPPWKRGHAFFKPALSDQELRAFQERKDNEERECYSKNSKPIQPSR